MLTDVESHGLTGCGKISTFDMLIDCDRFSGKISGISHAVRVETDGKMDDRGDLRCIFAENGEKHGNSEDTK